jgi:hypothetical protein
MLLMCVYPYPCMHPCTLSRLKLHHCAPVGPSRRSNTKSGIHETPNFGCPHSTPTPTRCSEQGSLCHNDSTPCLIVQNAAAQTVHTPHTVQSVHPRTQHMQYMLHIQYTQCIHCIQCTRTAHSTVHTVTCSTYSTYSTYRIFVCQQSNQNPLCVRTPLQPQDNQSKTAVDYCRLVYSSLQ